MSRKVLVTGATGYLGGRLLHSLNTGGSYQSIAGVRRTPASGNRSLALDFSDPAAIEKTDLTGIDAIVHLAGLNDSDCRRDPLLATTVNVLGTQALVNSALRAGVGTFIYVSTAHVYGTPLEGRLTETNSTHPAHSYGISHRAAEEGVLAANSDKKFQGVVVRVSNVVGAPLEATANCWTLLAHDLSRQAARARKMSLKSAGLQVRDFLPMSDFLRAIRFFLEAERSVLGDGLFNLGAGQSTRVRDLAQLVRERYSKLTNQEVALEIPEPDHPTDNPTFHFEIEKLRKAGFSPQASLSDAVDELARFCLENFS